jgi:hypothetical protein
MAAEIQRLFRIFAIAKNGAIFVTASLDIPGSLC